MSNILNPYPKIKPVNALNSSTGITKKNKEIIWSGIVTGKIKVVIGARSALFLPFKKLGLIIVDEEHDQSYKQDEGVIYNARDMAISRASFENIPINLITAVPSVETFQNIKKKKYKLSKLENRYQNASLPNYEIIDLNNAKMEKQSWISNEIIEKLTKIKPPTLGAASRISGITPAAVIAIMRYIKKNNNKKVA